MPFYVRANIATKYRVVLERKKAHSVFETTIYRIVGKIEWD
jgi:hypothetical protein